MCQAALKYFNVHLVLDYEAKPCYHVDSSKVPEWLKGWQCNDYREQIKTDSTDDTIGSSQFRQDEGFPKL